MSFIKRNWIALIIPVMLLFRILTELIDRITSGYAVDWGEIAVYLILIPVTFFTVYIILIASRSQKLWPKSIIGFLYSLFVVYAVDYWLVLEEYCSFALIRNYAHQPFAGSALFMGFPFYAFLSTVLLIPVFAIIMSSAPKSSKIIHRIPILTPWFLGIILLLVMNVTRGKFSNICIIRPSIMYSLDKLR